MSDEPSRISAWTAINDPAKSSTSVEPSNNNAKYCLNPDDEYHNQTPLQTQRGGARTEANDADHQRARFSRLRATDFFDEEEQPEVERNGNLNDETQDEMKTKKRSGYELDGGEFRDDLTAFISSARHESTSRAASRTASRPASRRSSQAGDDTDMDISSPEPSVTNELNEEQEEHLRAADYTIADIQHMSNTKRELLVQRGVIPDLPHIKPIKPPPNYKLPTREQRDEWEDEMAYRKAKGIPECMPPFLTWSEFKFKKPPTGFMLDYFKFNKGHLQFSS